MSGKNKETECDKTRGAHLATSEYDPPTLKKTAILGPPRAPHNEVILPRAVLLPPRFALRRADALGCAEGCGEAGDEGEDHCLGL